MAKATYTFQGYNLRMDQIQLIEPLRKRVNNIDGWMGIFIKPEKLNFKSQYEFAVWFTGKNGGYKDFYSKVIEFVGENNFKGDNEFRRKYETLVELWKEYHDGRNT